MPKENFSPLFHGLGGEKTFCMLDCIARETLQSKDDTVDKGSWLRFRSLRLGLCCSVGFLFSAQLKVDTDTFCVILIQKVSRFCSQAPSLH